MPTAPPRVCARCGRPAPKNRPCACRPAWEGSTHPGGHDDRRMAHAITTYRRAHPICEWPDCRRLVDHVDHIVPLAEGGDRYDHDNMQSLCEPHHTQKTTADALRGKRRLR
ncbi:HNH endonuclease signature motif containing protein [Mycobacterium sp. CSUR Q5927]|nr:HNH endonuclease signature motif containing protein [Mycobacterium sp. CSUR Q5927]